jgi:Na+-transporting methylmalonyl-CoA/oxaloacetate decarboxylase gamma subunit
MNDLTQSLEITALGMGLVFGAILLLWLMMILLTTFTADKNSPDDETAPDSAEVNPAPQAGYKAQAAALAVALALAEQGQSTARPLSQPPTALVSAWQLGMRTSQRSQKGSLGRR